MNRWEVKRVKLFIDFCQILKIYGSRKQVSEMCAHIYRILLSGKYYFLKQYTSHTLYCSWLRVICSAETTNRWLLDKYPHIYDLIYDRFCRFANKWVSQPSLDLKRLTRTPDNDRTRRFIAVNLFFWSNGVFQKGTEEICIVRYVSVCHVLRNNLFIGRQKSIAFNHWCTEAVRLRRRSEY